MRGGARIFDLSVIAEQHEATEHGLIRAGYADEAVRRMQAQGIPLEEQGELWHNALMNARAKSADRTLLSALRSKLAKDSR